MAADQTTRVLLGWKGGLYRFLKLDALSDGSLLILLDKAVSPKIGAQKTENGQLVDDTADDGLPKPHAKITCHTTGRVNYSAYGDRTAIFYIEPLSALTTTTDLAAYSIPTVGRLDTHQMGALALNGVTINVPDEVQSRLSFMVDIGPASEPDIDVYGVTLRYEHYKIAVRVISSAPFEPFGERLCTVVRQQGQGRLAEQAVEQNQAELDFYRRIHGSGPIIFRENDGSYVALTAVPMRIGPCLIMTFSQPGLSAEQIPYPEHKQITHKVRFWIKDKGGRNKTADLRSCIASFGFDARL